MHTWPKFSFVKYVNCVTKYIAVTEDNKFFLRDCFLLAHPVVSLKGE